MLPILTWWMEATFVRALYLLTGSINPAWAAVFGGLLLRWPGPRSAKQRFVDRNLRLAFPRLTITQYAQLAREVCANFGADLAEYPHLKTFGMTIGIGLTRGISV